MSSDCVDLIGVVLDGFLIEGFFYPAQTKIKWEPSNTL